MSLQQPNPSSSSWAPPPLARPSSLQPPATIISPPTPIEPQSSQAATFPTPRDTDDSDPEIEYDSPTSDPSMSDGEDEKHTETRPRDAANHLEPPGTTASSQISTSPQNQTALLHPDSPGLPSSPRASSSRPLSPRSPSPSSPHYRPRGMHQRRESSSHRVRETTDGRERNTEDGNRMVNQYKIGKSLGKGAYANVELGVDVGTGVEYVSSLRSHPYSSPY